MKMRSLTVLLVLTLGVLPVTAQQLPYKVSNVEVLDLSENPVKLPYFGKKHLMIFYVDPDRHSQNHDFTVELENTHRASSDEIYGFGVLNLKDAPMIPNGMARSMAKNARRRTTQSSSQIKPALCQQLGTLEIATISSCCSS